MVLCASIAVSADELKLKDGTKIVGTIIGFEDNSFKVKTSYGFALVQKDQVVSISMSSEAAKKPEPAAEKPAEPAKPAKTETTSKPAASPANENKPAHAVTPQPAKTETANGTATTASPESKTNPPPSSAAASGSGSAAPATSAITATPAPAAAPAAKPAPPKPPAPEPVREDVSGNTYTNDTYGFRMYKPPSWRMIEGARSILPGAITAMGPADESTYLLIGLAPAGETLTNDIDESEQRLREVMSNFRIIEQKRLMVSGISSIAHRFRGSVDQREWSGIVVFVPYGTHIYTVFGMTLAQSDLVQIQENVLTRTIASLQFSRQ